MIIDSLGNIISQSRQSISDIFSTLQCSLFPNPTTDMINIRYSLPHADRVRADIFDTNGSHIITLCDQTMNAGTHSIQAALNIPTGIYSVRIITSNEFFHETLIIYN